MMKLFDQLIVNQQIFQSQNSQFNYIHIYSIQYFFLSIQRETYYKFIIIINMNKIANIAKNAITKSIFQNKNSHKFSTSLLNKFINHKYARLCRYDKPTGALLIYWPVSWGVMLGLANPSSSLFYLSLFLMGSWTSRSAGCIINDLFDKDFDKKVDRTKSRPLATGQVTTKEATGLLFANLTGGLIVLTQLNLSALIATFLVLPIAGLYPLAKRYINYPQLVLGIACNSGVIIGALAMNAENIVWSSIFPIYMSGICWTLIYDTVYAFQDMEDDRKLGLKSTALTWGVQSFQIIKLLLFSSFLGHVILANSNSIYELSLPLTFLAHFYLWKQLQKVKMDNRESCAKFFKGNNIFGFLILLSLGFAKFIDEYKQSKQIDQKAIKK